MEETKKIIDLIGHIFDCSIWYVKVMKDLFVRCLYICCYTTHCGELSGCSLPFSCSRQCEIWL